jgi:hypothetical protein
MKKTVVVDIEYMRPSDGRRSCSRSRSRSRSRNMPTAHVTENTYDHNNGDDGDDDDLNISALLHNTHTWNSESGSVGDSDGSESILSDTASSSASITTTTELTDDEPSCALPTRHPSVNDSDYAVNSDDDLLQSVLDEPTFPLDINAILSAMNKRENNTIANMTLKKIAARRHEILSSLNVTPEKMEEFERKLHMYRVIEDPHDLKHNQLIRWIPLRSLETRPYVTLGGCLFRIKQNETDGIHIVTIRNVKRFVFNIKFELNVVFQRLSQEELLILRAVEFVESDDTEIRPSARA